MRFPPLPVHSPDPDETIPPLVHLVWVGSPAPSWVKAAVARWRAALPSEYTVWFWTDHSIHGTPLQRVCEVAESYGLTYRSVADAVKAYAVGLLGGWYFDVDMVLLRPLPTGLSALTYSDAEFPDRVAWTGAFGCTQFHPFPSQVVEYGQEALDRGVRDDHFVMGPRVHHRAWETTQIPASFTATMVRSAPLSRLQAQGCELPLDMLRDRYPESTVVHLEPEAL